MQNFNLGSLATWKPLAIGEILELDLPESGSRSVSFDVLAAGTVAINVVSGEDYWLAAYGDGLMPVKFTTDRPVGIVAVGDSSIDVFVRTLTDAPTIPESLEASYTSIEPRPAGPSEDVRQMMYIMKLNQARRDAQLAAERTAMAAELQAMRDAYPTATFRDAEGKILSTPDGRVVAVPESGDTDAVVE